MEEKDIYKELSAKMTKVFGTALLKEGSMSRSEIIRMVSNLIDSQGVENVQELQLEGIKEIMLGMHDPSFHMTTLGL